MKFNITVLFFFLFGAVHIQAQDFKLQNGDLIFQESGISNLEKSIREVTTSIGDYQFTHVGIVYIDDNDSVFVLEATTPKLVLTPINEYLYPKDNKGNYPRSVVGRLNDEYQSIIPKALALGFPHIGTGYDYGFVVDNDKYYCSELIYEILKEANNGVEVFSLAPMTFRSKGTTTTTKGWIEYFNKHNLPIPEGELGISPGAMSQSDVLRIVHYY
ncbi:YiiX/YebB-like N1pC/P60 family cysteine hydrolase [Dysgonomonas macrotermitis]|uniref:Permuted papain-like amidase enzyme, YaeF/YiiX, C92 family n=1 Tax=Dysgonomonas macrotermitis TaxID=1346286 RepID=A0A1M4UCQ8_9BACT|nr:YiiX/YebB-like N1pC/P60 family cysteine hydrolase [Dysgonomonas macrotermitis]SHE54363.1 Permuted papain-like amidase enzyme, YaeF/YiiX, C92 family [Dysgonomonas macrotermitis]